MIGLNCLESKDGRGHASRKQSRLRQILPQWVAVEGVFNFFTGHRRHSRVTHAHENSGWQESTQSLVRAVACNHLIKNGNSRSMLPLASFSFGSKKVHIWFCAFKHNKRIYLTSFPFQVIICLTFKFDHSPYSEKLCKHNQI